MRFIFRTLGLFLSLQLAHAVAYSYTVTELTALYQNGQVFLTWKNPTGTNLQYNVYRSSLPLLTSAQLTSSTFLGYVRDNSGQNARKTGLNTQGQTFYYVITTGQSPLASDRGLYVATCAASGTWYYAVTVTDLSNGQENKTVTVGSNSLLLGVSQTVAKPQPVLQTITTQNNGDISSEYVLFGDNQELSHWRAFNNVGSYGYVFTWQTRGVSLNQPLYVFFQDANPYKQADSALCPNGNILQVDDRLPNGQGTYWIGYNNQYNMYTANNLNPKVTSGFIHTYSQAVVQAIIRWTKRQAGVDSNRIYMTGLSHCGFGAMLTAMNMPKEIACVYNVAGPVIYKTLTGDSREYQLCKSTSNIPTDITYPGTNDTIPIWNYTNMRTWLRVNTSGVPFMQSINGRNDNAVGWIQKFHWYDTVNVDRQGGIWYWDQRQHSGSGAQFIDAETRPVYTRYYSNKSYPAFSYCSINQNPGSGLSTDGDPYGAINGYLDWKDNSILDQNCSYSIKCFVKNFYVGGVLAAKQYDSCYSDITIRRTQHFHPTNGQTINWTNYGAGNKLLQSGSFVYDGKAITLYGIKIKKTISKITLNIVNCKSGDETVVDEINWSNNLHVFPNPFTDATTISFSLDQSENITLKVFDVTGRLITIIANETMSTGEHELQWNAEYANGNDLLSGIYLLKMETGNHSETIRMVVAK